MRWLLLYKVIKKRNNIDGHIESRFNWWNVSSHFWNVAEQFACSDIEHFQDEGCHIEVILELCCKNVHFKWSNPVQVQYKRVTMSKFTEQVRTLLENWLHKSEHNVRVVVAGCTDDAKDSLKEWQHLAVCISIGAAVTLRVHSLCEGCKASVKRGQHLQDIKTTHLLPSTLNISTKHLPYSSIPLSSILRTKQSQQGRAPG